MVISEVSCSWILDLDLKMVEIGNEMVETVGVAENSRCV